MDLPKEDTVAARAKREIDNEFLYRCSKTELISMFLTTRENLRKTTRTLEKTIVLVEALLLKMEENK
jgi:hypothetical protein